VVTNGTVQRQQAKITHLQIRPYLSTIVVSEAVQVKKPDQRIFAQALAALGCSASQTWFVGDHPHNDILGAAASGLRAIWLTGIHPWPPEHPQPPWQIRTLSDVVDMVHREQHTPDSGGAWP
jgi:putative hydrolase of the HAD superfamily